MQDRKGRACATFRTGQSVNGGNRIELIRRTSPASTVGSLRGEFEQQRSEVSWTGRFVGAGLRLAMVHRSRTSHGLSCRLKGPRFDRPKTGIGAIPISHLVPLCKFNRESVSTFQQDCSPPLLLEAQAVGLQPCPAGHSLRSGSAKRMCQNALRLSPARSTTRKCWKPHKHVCEETVRPRSDRVFGRQRSATRTLQAVSTVQFPMYE